MSTGVVTRLRTWARGVKRDVTALTFAVRDFRVPWYAKAVAGFVVAYALSPIDLIPDFIPVLGYFDDAIIVPLGILLAIKLIPIELMAEFRARAALQEGRSPGSRTAAIVIVAFWLLGFLILIDRVFFRTVF